MTAVGDGGGTYSYDDGNGSTVCVDPNFLCGAGITAVGDALGTVWGAGIGFALNAANVANATENPYVPPSTSSGIYYAVSSVPVQGLRIVTDVSGSQYCADVSLLSGLVPWTSFNTACWAPTTGSYLSGPPSTSHYIQFQVPAIYGGPRESFNFCVDNVFYE
jgi:hypothetical protein